MFDSLSLDYGPQEAFIANWTQTSEVSLSPNEVFLGFKHLKLVKRRSRWVNW